MLLVPISRPSPTRGDKLVRDFLAAREVEFATHGGDFGWGEAGVEEGVEAAAIGGGVLKRSENGK